MSGVAVAALGAIALAAVLVFVRLLRGPRVLDRIVAVDVLVTLLVAGTAVAVAVWGYTTAVPVLVVLSLLAFVGSVTAARLVGEREDMR